MRLAAALLAAALLGGGCGNTRRPEPPAPANPGADVVWRAVGAWSGQGDRQTDSFDVTTGALQLRWSARETTPGTGRLKVSLHSAISGRPLQTVLEVRGGGAATVYIEDEPRVSYLVIESAGVEWRADLSERVSGPGDR